MDDAAPSPAPAGDAAETVVDLSPSKRRRYRIRDQEGKRVIVSGNAPNLRLRIEKGLTVDAKGRKRFGPQTIFLDGVYSGPPFCDNGARHYSLDHHAGVVRAFTLSTCEQAAVMLLQGLPLSAEMWDVYVNDPDLDSMLAAWVLLNHVELLENDKALLRAAMPLIRLEGVIDAHGTEREMLTAFPEEFHAQTRAQVDELMSAERELKTQGAWMSTDWIEYARGQLERMDRMFFPEQALDELLQMQESGRAVLANERIAVLMESTSGIYEVEARLKARYGGSLGLIVLKTGQDRYTVRLVDAFLPKDLNALYKALNRVDPKVRLGGDKPNVWGGSGDIGGTPRATGTGLSGDDILAVASEVLGVQPPWWKKLYVLVQRLIKGSPKALPPGQ